MSYVAIVTGLLLISGSVIAWRSEVFFEYFWRATAANRTRYQPKLTVARGRIGVRGTLALAATAGLVLVAAGIYALT